MEKKYKCIVKVGPKKFVSYHVTNLLLFTAFLDRHFPDWRYCNVFSKKTGEQLGNFSKNNRPTSRFIS